MRMAKLCFSRQDICLIVIGDGKRNAFVARQHHRSMLIIRSFVYFLLDVLRVYQITCLTRVFHLPTCYHHSRIDVPCKNDVYVLAILVMASLIESFSTTHAYASQAKSNFDYLESTVICLHMSLSPSFSFAIALSVSLVLPNQLFMR